MFVMKYSRENPEIEEDEFVESLKMVVSDGADITEMCEAFENMLRGMGYPLGSGGVRFIKKIS